MRPMTYRPQSKYRNRKTTVDGFTFDSRKEANRYLELKFLEATGEITDLELQVPFTLQPAFRDCNGEWQRDIKYIADFVYKDKDGKQVIEDVKGKRTAVYMIKKKMMLYKGLKITEV